MVFRPDGVLSCFLPSAGELLDFGLRTTDGLEMTTLPFLLACWPGAVPLAAVTRFLRVGAGLISMSPVGALVADARRTFE